MDEKDNHHNRIIFYIAKSVKKNLLDISQEIDKLENIINKHGIELPNEYFYSNLVDNNSIKWYPSHIKVWVFFGLFRNKKKRKKNILIFFTKIEKKIRNCGHYGRKT